MSFRDLETAKEYCGKHSTKSTRKMAKQLLEDGPLKHFTVLTPVLATTDKSFIKNYVEQYAKQSLQKFTVVLYPNASREVDPEQEAVQECVKLVKSLKLEHPDLDLRVVINPHPPKKFTSIGSIRKALWDSATLAVVEGQDSIVFKRENLPNSEEEISSDDFVEVLATLGYDYHFINHDVDVVYMPRKYMEQYLLGIGYYSIIDSRSSKPIAAYNSRTHHSREVDKPNASGVIAVYDYLFSSARYGFEAGIAIPLTTYVNGGGFKTEQYTYEVAGFANKLGKIKFIDNSAMTTSPRRVHYKIHDSSIEQIWGDPKAGKEKDFGEKDPCRKSRSGDITRERADELIEEWEAIVKFSVFILDRALTRFVLTTDPKEEVLVKAVTKALGREESEGAWKSAMPVLHRYTNLGLAGLERILTAAGYSNPSELLRKVSKDLEVEIKLLLEREYTAAEVDKLRSLADKIKVNTAGSEKLLDSSENVSATQGVVICSADANSFFCEDLKKTQEL